MVLNYVWSVRFLSRLSLVNMINSCCSSIKKINDLTIGNLPQVSSDVLDGNSDALAVSVTG